MSDKLRITGLASGLDVDSMVKTMMKAENMKMDKLKQDKQVLQWRQDLYRDVIGNINIFKSSYFDVLKSDSFILSPSTYSAFDILPSNSIVATASAGAGATPGTYTLKNITLAETANYKGNAIKTKEAQSTISWPKAITAGNNDSIDINIDGTSYGSITIDAKAYTSMADLAGAINTKLAGAKDAGGVAASTKVKAMVSDDGTRVEFSPMTQISLANKDITISLGDGTTTTNYKITLDEGSYTLKELTSAINKKLNKAVNLSNNNSIENISGKVTFAVTNNGTTISAQPEGIIKTAYMDQNYNTAMNMTGSAIDISSANTISTGGLTIDSTNNTITASIGGVSYNIFLASGTYTNPSEVSNTVNTALASAKKVGDATNSDYDLTSSLSAQISMDGTRLQFINNTSTNPPAQINLMGTAMKTLGYSSAITDLYPTGNERMSSLINTLNSSGGYVEFTVNNVQFQYDFSTLDKDKTINDILDDISSKAGVRATYNELGQAFTLSSNSTGSDQQISASETGVTNKFLSTLFGSSSISDQGDNASVTITDPKGNTTTVNRTTNSFTIDGVNYNLQSNDSTANGVTITLTSNTQKVFDKIKSFVDKYNETIDKIKGMTTEKRQYTYKPLTDDQKKDMKDDDIKKWEDKGKEGLLSNDPILTKMLNSMRRAFSDAVEGSGITLGEIGLSTDMDYTKGGKIIINEVKLKDAIQNKGDRVAKLFSQDSDIPYDANHIKDGGRYNGIGIFQRINDIIKDNTRTTRDSSGKKGLLAEKAGIVGDLSEFENLLSKQMRDDFDKRINTLSNELYEKENKYYEQFSKLESAMQQMNSQSSWLSQQLGMMGGNA